MRISEVSQDITMLLDRIFNDSICFKVKIAESVITELLEEAVVTKFGVFVQHH